MPDTRTPTETLLSVLEDFGQSEPKNVIVIYVNEDGEMVWQRSTMGLSETVGMLECVKHSVLATFCAQENKL